MSASRGNPAAVTANATYTGDSGLPHRVLVMRTFLEGGMPAAYMVFIVSGGTLPAGVRVRVPARRVMLDAEVSK